MDNTVLHRRCFASAINVVQKWREHDKTTAV